MRAMRTPGRGGPREWGEAVLRAAGRLLAPLPRFVDTDALVRPHRYDVVMRERFVGFYESRRDLFREDRAAFDELARAEPYYRFFAGIASASAALRRLHPGETPDALFARKVEAFVAIIDSIAACGLAPGGSIQLKLHLRGADRGSLSIGDGCHRLAVLRHLRGPVLDSGYFFVTPCLATARRNNTAALEAAGLLTRQERLEASGATRENVDLPGG
jgi:hypothetical protein